jgi:hypothetical protein
MVINVKGAGIFGFPVNMTKMTFPSFVLNVKVLTGINPRNEKMIVRISKVTKDSLYSILYRTPDRIIIRCHI